MKTTLPQAIILCPGGETLSQMRERLYSQIEYAARTCYQSGDMTTETSASGIIKRLIQNKHTAMLEHASFSVQFFVDRGLTHEFVRHRLASFAQESTRYCNYSKGKFGSEITCIDIAGGIERDPKMKHLTEEQTQAVLNEWYKACEDAEQHYFRMLELGASPQIARSVLNNSTKSSLVITANITEWRHILSLRALGTTGAPHPQMLEVMEDLLFRLNCIMPELFGDLYEKLEESKNHDKQSE